MRGLILVVVFPLILTTALAVSAPDEDAQGPSRPLEIIVPFAPGGGLDVATRILAKYAEPELGQNIVVSNMTKGGNIEGNLLAMRAEPDGQVLGAWGSGLATDELLIKGVPYTHGDVRPVCLFANDPEVIGVGREFAETNGIRSLADMLAYAAANPGRVSFGVGGNWTVHDFLRLKIENHAGVKFNRMPFLGGALAARAAARGNCDVVVPFLSEILPHLETGRVVPLAVAYEKRLAQIPDIPTTAELGYPEVTQTIWRVLTLPRDTPQPILEFLENAFAKAAENPAYIEEARKRGVNPVFMGSKDTEAFVQKEFEYYSGKIAEWGIGVEK